MYVDGRTDGQVDGWMDGWMDVPVDLAIAPMSMEGTDMMRQPAAATNDKSWARPALLDESTRWK